jgi:hypothetical protein
VSGLPAADAATVPKVLLPLSQTWRGTAAESRLNEVRSPLHATAASTCVHQECLTAR